MKKLVLVVFLAALAVPAVAQAKGALGVEMCGADGCKQQRFATVNEAGGGPFTGKGGIVTPAKPGPWLRGAILIGEPNGRVFGRIPFFYVAGSDLMIDPGDSNQQPAWWHPQGELATLVHALAPKVTPFAVPKEITVAVNGVAVQDPKVVPAAVHDREALSGIPEVRPLRPDHVPVEDADPLDDRKRHRPLHGRPAPHA